MEPQEILAEGRLEAWQQLAAAIAARHEVETVKEPETCLAMMQTVDSVGETPFYLGEVLMCEATVRVKWCDWLRLCTGGRAGTGMVPGGDRCRPGCRTA